MAYASPVKFVAYFRVSTEQQGRSGLGLEAQKASVASYIKQSGGVMVAEFEEVESGKCNQRPALAAALAACRAHRSTLVIAKLDRLSRNTRFLLSIVEGSGEGGVVFCDLPTVPAGPVGKFLITQMAAVAELEAGLISQRTKAALAAAKARGVKLGSPRLTAGTAASSLKAAQAASTQAKQRAADVLPLIQQARNAGATTLQSVADAMTARGIPTPGGRGSWTATTVKRAMAYAA